ncbi:MAG: hypothetical protein GX605_02715 [Chloroflexi bacterium]|nr:hypothetical protein [Chloroflexota bacterium]
MRRILPSVAALAAGLLVLLDIFIENPLLDAVGWGLTSGAVILAAFALLAGAYNVMASHFRKVTHGQQGWPYSVVLIVALWVVLVVGLLDPHGPNGRAVAWVFWNVQFPLQSTFFALLALYVATAAYRAFRVRRPEGVLMLVAGLIVLVGQSPLGGLLSDHLPDAASWIVAIPSMAGVRGILIGVALGTVATGLRLLMGLDKPYVR